MSVFGGCSYGFDFGEEGDIVGDERCEFSRGVGRVSYFPYFSNVGEGEFFFFG